MTSIFCDNNDDCKCPTCNRFRKLTNTIERGFEIVSRSVESLTEAVESLTESLDVGLYAINDKLSKDNLDNTYTEQ